jgi:hypothetical protein
MQNNHWGIRNLEEVSEEGKKKWLFSRRYY